VRYAFIGAPYLGGVYTVYRSLRASLAEHEVEVRWVGTGEQALRVMVEPAWACEQGNGEAIHEPASEVAEGAALCRHIEATGYDGVFVNVRMRPVEMNAARHLPASIRRIMIVHSTQPGTYGPAGSLRGFVHATVGVSPRIRDDLVRRRGFDTATTHCIYTGVDIGEFAPAARGPGDGLRLLYLGRIEERQKGVFWLPQIMSHLTQQPISLTIAGDGPDLVELRRRCAPLGDRVRFLGGVPRHEVPAVLMKHDVMVMPSRWEGLGLSLVEAMAAGCVPVVSDLKGVTDSVITHKVDGLLFRVGDAAEAARQIMTLAHDFRKLMVMSEAARTTVAQRFGLEMMGHAYAGLIANIRDADLSMAPLSLERWSYPMSFNNPIRRLVPESLKRWMLARN
jgi:glycosyltransferase involved in cell wall biosynthesis